MKSGWRAAPTATRAATRAASQLFWNPSGPARAGDAAAQRPYRIYFSPSRVHSLAKFRGGEAQGLGKLGDVLDSGIAQTALNPANVGRIKSGAFGQFFLCELFRFALAADVQSQRGEDSVAF